jgi:hypothetical protein
MKSPAALVNELFDHWIISCNDSGLHHGEWANARRDEDVSSKPDQQGRDDRVLLIVAEFKYTCIFCHGQYILLDSAKNWPLMVAKT